MYFLVARSNVAIALHSWSVTYSVELVAVMYSGSMSAAFGDLVVKVSKRGFRRPLIVTPDAKLVSEKS